MPKISDDFLSELNRQTDIGELISGYVTLHPRGGRMVGLCPFHNEKTGSFTVFPQTNSYYCFGCGAGGSPITFVRQIENLDFFEAVKFLADKAGMQVPISAGGDGFSRFKKRILEINREAARFYHTHLLKPEGAEVLNYFLSRGLKPETIKHFGLGAAPNAWDTLTKYLKSKGYKEEELIQANITVKSKNGRCYDNFRNRAMFPIIDLRGNVIGFGGRALPGEDAKGRKYINTSDTPVFKKSQNLYALNFAKSSCSKQIILAEGYMDVISLHQAGITNAVAALGTAFTDEHASLLARYTSEIVITFDADAAGQKATDRALKIFSKSGLSTKILRIPDGKDPDEFIKKNGDSAASAFENLIGTSMNSIEYKLIGAANGIDTTTEAGKLEYIKKCIQILAECQDSIAAELYAGKLADKFGISKETILSKIKDKTVQYKRNNHKKKMEEIIRLKTSSADVNPEKKKNLRAANAEELIISILILNPDLKPYCDKELKPEQFITEYNRRVFIRLCEVIENGHNFDVSLLGSEFTPAETARVAQLQNRAIKGENARKELIDCINVLKAEGDALSNPEELSDEEWAKQMKLIAKDKK